MKVVHIVRNLCSYHGKKRFAELFLLALCLNSYYCRTSVHYYQACTVTSSIPQRDKLTTRGSFSETNNLLCRKATGLSGRCLRQLPVIGYSKLPVVSLNSFFFFFCV